MYLFQPLDPVCDGPTAEQIDQANAGRSALDAAVERAMADVYQLTMRPDLDSRGQLLVIDPATGQPAIAPPSTPSWEVTPTRYARAVMSSIPMCVSAPPPQALHSRQAGLAGFVPFLNGRRPRGFAGSVAQGSGTVAMYPPKSLFLIGDKAQIVITGPPGWIVRQRNLWQGRSTGETLEGDRTFYVPFNTSGGTTIGADGRFQMNLTFGPRDVGEWVYEFEFVQKEVNSSDQGRSLHGGLNWIPASQIQGDPISFSVQGQPDIPPRLDYTAYFADRPGMTEQYYRDFVAMYEHIDSNQVKVPNYLRQNHGLLTDADTEYAKRQQAIATELNAARMFGYDSEVEKWAAAADYYGPHPHPIGYKPSRIAAVIDGDFSQLTQAERDFLDGKTNSIVSAVDGSTITINRPLTYAPDGHKYTAQEYSALISGGTLPSSGTASTAAASPSVLQSIVNAVTGGNQAAVTGGTSVTGSPATSGGTVSSVLNSIAPAALPAGLKQEAAGLPIWAWGIAAIGAVWALKK